MLPEGYGYVHVLREERSGRLVLARRDTDDALEVVLRVLPPAPTGDADYIHRLHQDIGRLRDCSHPTVIEPCALIVTPDMAVIESPLVDGVRLDELIASGALTPEAGLVVLSDLLDGLAWMHRFGVVHRDVRPGCVVVEPSGGVRLGDAAIALTGAPAYLAPELWHGENPSPATDIYSATATVFEALTGAPPFPATHHHALRTAHLHHLVPLDRVPEVARPLLEDGLAKTAAKRPVSAVAFRDRARHVAIGSLGEDWETRGRSQLATLVLCNARLLPSAGSSGMLREVEAADAAETASRLDRPRRYRFRFPGIGSWGLIWLLFTTVAGFAVYAWTSNAGVDLVRQAVSPTPSIGAPTAPPGVPRTPATSSAPATPSVLPPTPLPTAQGHASLVPVAPPPAAPPTAAPPAPTPTPTAAPTPTPTPSPTPSDTPSPTPSPTA